jgi:hypothetical protein
MQLFSVIPAKAGIQRVHYETVDSCFRRNDRELEDRELEKAAHGIILQKRPHSGSLISDLLIIRKRIRRMNYRLNFQTDLFIFGLTKRLAAGRTKFALHVPALQKTASLCFRTPDNVFVKSYSCLQVSQNSGHNTECANCFAGVRKRLIRISNAF